MLLFELFDTDGPSIKTDLQQSVIDVLTPLLANKVPFVSVQSIIDNLKQTRPGILIDRALVMSLLDPEAIQSISKVEGDRVYLQGPDEESADAAQSEQEDQIDNVKKAAIQNATGNLKKNS